MAKRKPRRPPKRGPTQRYVLEDLAAKLLADRALRTLKRQGEACDDASLVTLAATRMVGDGKDAVMTDEEYTAIWSRRIAELITGCGDLHKLVHVFLNRLPIYLTGTPSEVAQAVWTDILHAQVSQIVEDVLYERDAHGEPRFLELEDEHFIPNPDFIEPG